MKPRLRILDTGLMPARWNVAMTAALAELHARPQTRADAPPAAGDGTLRPAPHLSCERPGPPEDTMRFHRYPTCVLLGAGQDLERVTDAAYCRQAGIEIARRVTGGAAVYMSPGMLAWDVLVTRAAFGGDLAAVTERVCGGVAVGPTRLGAAARFRAPNDIEIGGRKVSGSSGYTGGRAALLQGTVLVADDVPAMARALRLPEPALRARTTCLAAEIGGAPALPAMIEAITMALAEALQREPAAARPRDAEIALCEALLRDEIGTDAYTAGHSPAQA